MNHQAKYSIVRFSPYTETEEFANIGVVMISASARYFGYLVMSLGARRVTSFFEPLDPMVFRHARQLFLNELDRVKDASEKAFCRPDSLSSDIGLADRMFEEFTRRREAAIYLSKVRVVLTPDPARRLEELYEHYVKRAFVYRPMHDIEVTKHVQAILARKNLSPFFKQQSIGRDDFKVQFPLVSTDLDGNPLSAIKPIFLGHEDPAKLYRYGWEWAGRIRKLHNDHHLPSKVLFAVKGPDVDLGPRADAFSQVVEQLEQDGVQVVPEDAEGEIVDFAESAMRGRVVATEPNDLLG